MIIRIPSGLVALATMLFMQCDPQAAQAQNTENKQPIGSVNADPGMKPGSSTGQTDLSNLYSLSLYDGSANIRIPIYQYEAEGADFGIAFTYNTRGVTVNEWASPVGLHFNLTSGSITRTVKGQPDELNVIAPDSVDVPPPIGSPNGSSARRYANRFTRFRGKFACYGETPAEAANTKTFRDRESDEFQVNAGKLSFSFRLGRNGTVFTHPQRRVKVEFTLDGIVVSNITSQAVGANDLSQVPGFIITDEEGSKYYFKAGDYELKEITDDYWGSVPISSYYVVNKWDLTKVVLSSGLQLTFEYLKQSLPTAYKQYSAYSVIEKLGAVFLGGPYYGSDIFYTSLQKVRYPNGVTADLVYDAAPRCDNSGRALREIRISSQNNCLRYQLDQFYFFGQNNAGVTERPYGSNCNIMGNDPTLNNQYHRLGLRGINLVSCDGSLQEPYYSFTYDATPLPRRLWGGQDWFGYANGAFPLRYSGGSGNPIDTNFTVPLHTCYRGVWPYDSTRWIGVDKTVNPDKLRGNLLTGIANAYGGSITFAYEGHSGLAEVLTGLPTDPFYFGKNAADGLRVSKVTEQDSYHAGNARVTTIDYQDGQLFLNGGYFHYPQWMTDGTDDQDAINLGGMYVSPHHMVNGANHGYGTVTVTTATNTGQQLSRKVATFSNFKDATSNGQPRYQLNGDNKHFYQFPYTDKQYLRDWEMGQPLSLTEYDQNNNIVQQTLNSYGPTTMVLAPEAEVHEVMVQRTGIEPSDGLGWWAKRQITDTYYPFTGQSQLKQTVIRKYTTNTAFIADTMRYDYDSRNNLKTIATRNSKGEEVQTIQYYNYDAGTDDPQPGLEKLVSTQRWKRVAGGAMPDNGVLLDAYFTGLAANGSTGSYSLVRNKNLYNLQASAPLSYSAYLGASSTSLKIKAAAQSTPLPGFSKTSEVLQSDAKGNPLETYLPEGQQYKAMIWDTTTGQKIAEAVGARYSDIAYTSFETGTYNTNINLLQAGYLATGGASGNICLNLWNATTMTGNVLEGTQNLQAGKEYLLSFWVSGPNPAVSLVGGSSIAIPATPAATKGSWNNYILRFTPAAGTKFRIAGTAASSYLDEVRLCPASALMQSWTYEPLFGPRSETGPTGRIITYAYDAFGRPYLVRDQEGHILNKTQTVVKGAE